MGSRAVVLLCRDAGSATARFGFTGGATGTVHTRTGRSFFGDPALTEGLLGELRDAVSAAGMWEELDTNWLLLDAELLPWSAKAAELLRRQYAPVGAAARAALPAAISAIEQTAGRGIDTAELLARQRSRAVNAAAFTAAYGRYCWPVDGLHGIALAPFQILATEGRLHADRDHGWHLERMDTLAAANPKLIRQTRRLVVDTTDAESIAAGTRWWTEVTSTGGEGMVVKPFDGLARGKRTLIQPGIKCRGPEYLRIIYGPDYAEPENLTRLRQRHLGRKRSLALQEYALGLEALARLADGEPPWRIHECVFAVLALESEPVDPRL